MTAAVNEPQPVAVAYTAEEARAVTDQIRGCVDRTWTLLIDAYERRAWVALDYSSWQSYVTHEFGIGRSRSYQLIDQAKVIREIADAAAVHTVDITEAVARDIKPHLAEVVEQVRDAVVDVPEPDRPAVVAEVVRDARDQVITDRRADAAPPPPSPAPAAPTAVADADTGTGDEWSPSATLDKPPARPPSSRPSSRPSTPATFEQDFAVAALALHKAANAVERLSGDPRFAPRIGKLDAKHRSFIADAVEGLNLVLIRLRPVKS